VGVRYRNARSQGLVAVTLTPTNYGTPAALVPFTCNVMHLQADRDAEIERLKAEVACLELELPKGDTIAELSSQFWQNARSNSHSTETIGGDGDG
jgi:hypothetical protein